jgi:hypothetical protein
MADKKTAHTESELMAIYEENKFDKRYFSNFVAYYQLCFDELYSDMKDYEDDDFEPGDSIQASALSISIDYMHSFIEMINKGHGQTWAHQMAHSCEEVERAAFYTYFDIRAENPEQAEKEMLIYCKNINGDELFQKYFFYLLRELENPDYIVEKATTYSNTYKEQIKKGKSEIYAHEYANLYADNEFVQSYCESYAYAYDKSLQEGKSEEYARRFADLYSNRIGENYSRLSDALKDEDFNFWHEKMIGNMKGWEYATENKLSDIESFIDLYDNTHINTYYADEPLSPKMSNEEIDKMILEKTLERYEKRGGK